MVSISFFLAFLFTNLSLSASLDVNVAWQTESTAHFVIYFPEGSEEVVSRLRQMAEEIYTRVVPEDQQNGEPYHIILTSNPDVFPEKLGNPSTHRRLYLSPFPPLSFLYFGLSARWLEERLFFEFLKAYFLSQKESFGEFVWPALVFSPSGKQEMPLWLVAGMAAYPEMFDEKMAFQERALYGIFLRTAFLQERGRSGDFSSFETLSHSYPAESLEQIPLYVGRKFLLFLNKKFGRQKMMKFFSKTARGIPYLSLGRQFRKNFGSRIQQSWQEFIEQLKFELTIDQEKIETSKGVSWQIFPTLDHVFHPRVSPLGNELLMVGWKNHNQTFLQIVDLKTQDIVWKYERLGGFDGSFAPGGQSIVFSDFTKWGVLDLFVYNRQTDEVKRISTNINAYSPEFSPDGKWVAFIHRSSETENLALMNYADRKWMDLTESAAGIRVLHPRWSPDGSTVTFVTLDKGGIFSLFAYDLVDQDLQKLFSQKSPILFPLMVTENVCLYISPARGNFDLYSWGLYEQSKQLLLRQKEGIFGFDVFYDDDVFMTQQKQLFAALYTREGFQVGKTIPAFLPLLNKRAKPVDLNIGIVSPETKKEEKPKNGKEKKEQKPKIGSYTIWGTTFPATLSPWFNSVERGALIGGRAYVTDVLNRHHFDVVFAGDTRASGEYASGPYFRGEYRNRQLPIDFILRGENVHTFMTRKKRMHRRIEGEILLEPNFPLFDGEFSFFGGWGLRKIVVKRKGHSRLQEAYGVPKAGFSFDDRVRTKADFSYTSGRLLTMQSDFALNQNNEDEFYYTISGNYQEYIPLDMLWNELILAINISWATAQKAFHLIQFYQVGGELGYVFDREPYVIRGYDYHEFLDHNPLTINTEFRFPIYRIFKGTMTPPFLVKTLHGAWITDVGTERTSRGYKVGIGLETRLDITLLRDYEVTLRGGVHQGLSRLGKTVGFIGVSKLF